MSTVNTTSYPSPMSSPGMPETGAQNLPSVDVHVQGRASLEQASTAIQEAFQRIRMIRRNLVERATESAASDSTRSERDSDYGRTDIGPSHEAIVLAEPVADDMLDQEEEALLARLGVALPAQTLRRLRAYEASRVRQGQDGPLSREEVVERPAFIPTFIPPTIPSPPSPPTSPPRQQLLPRRQLLETQLLRRRELSDDPNTSLGQHVAAREAAVAAGAASSAASASETRVFSSNVERDLEYFRSIARSRRSEPGVTARVDSVFDNIRRNDERSSRSLDSRNPDAHSAPLRLAPRRRVLRNDRPITGSTSATTTTTTSTSTSVSSGPRHSLSILSNVSLPLENLPTPTSATSQRPLLFEEPSSFVQSPVSGSSRRLSEDRFGSVLEDEGRSYQVRRTYTADGQEQVHSINLEWEEEEQPIRWLPPLQEQQEESISIGSPPARPRGGRQGHVRDNTVQLPPSPESAYRAGMWPPSSYMTPERSTGGGAASGPFHSESNLDEDGDLDRTILSRQRAYRPRSPNFSSNANVYETNRLLRLDSDPAARMLQRLRALRDSIIPNGNSGAIVPDPDDPYGAMHWAPDPNEREVIGSSAPLVVSALPMPLEDMVAHGNGRQRAAKAVHIPRQACFAGR